ncbi:DUF4153 domain-containing protein [Shimia haliotis]|uniref:DUF4153 domain-containing protein n=1 Tax=Shimia haliotis TaxID=1280847 RepID=A0A1I3ZWE6_9RHOB|nr:DUF4153 domain-containing protein [Shimia haliotis]SFK48343.1 protein of unknown function [Shimia haliotis]
MYSEDGRTMAGRAEMAIIGAAAGLTVWALGEKAPDIITNPHAYLAVVAFGAGFFAVLLGLSGPHRVARAAVPAFVLGLAGAGLLTLSSLRFVSLDGLLDAGHPIFAWFVFMSVATPFAAVKMVQKESLTDYGRLFDTSWSLLVRYSAGWLFTGVLFAVAFLSNALLEIVGITVIEDLLRNDPFRWAFLGFALGLGLSVVHELRQYLSPYLLLRMLRMLVPVVLVVVAIFAVAAMLQGPDQLFGSLSRAATLLTVAIVMVSLVSIALDRGDADAIGVRWMQIATAALAVLLPVIAGLAAYAIWLRVSQYGWTPPRMVAAGIAFVVLLYAVAYPIAVVTGGGWMARVRTANVWIALATLFLSGLWMTPVLNAERISTDAQVARAQAGELRLDQVPLWEMYHEWGRAGRAGLSALAQASDRALADAAQAQLSGQSLDKASKRAGQIAALLDVLVVLPEGETVSAEDLQNLTDWELGSMNACGEALVQRCVWVAGQFDGAKQGRQAFLFKPANAGTLWRGWLVTEQNGGLEFDTLYLGGGDQTVSQMHIERLISGDYRIAPSRLNSLWIGDDEILPID